METWSKIVVSTIYYMLMYKYAWFRHFEKKCNWQNCSLRMYVKLDSDIVMFRGLGKMNHVLYYLQDCVKFVVKMYFCVYMYFFVDEICKCAKHVTHLFCWLPCWIFSDVIISCVRTRHGCVAGASSCVGCIIESTFGGAWRVRDGCVDAHALAANKTDTRTYCNDIQIGSVQ